MSLRLQERPHLPLRAIGFGCGGAFLFTLQDACFKWYAQDYTVIQIIFMRCFLALLISILWVWRHGGWNALRIKYPRLLFISVVANVTAWYCFYSGLAMMPLTIAISIFFLTPVFVATAAVPLLNEPLTWRQIAALLLGFSGVLIITNPFAETAPVTLPAAGLILLSALMWGTVAIITRTLESSITVGGVLLYNNIAFLIVSCVFQSAVWITPTAADGIGMFLLGALGVAAQACVFVAYRSARAAVAATAEYSALVWALIIGWLVWGETFAERETIGAAFIIAAGLIVMLVPRRRHERDIASMSHHS